MDETCFFAGWNALGSLEGAACYGSSTSATAKEKDDVVLDVFVLIK